MGAFGSKVAAAKITGGGTNIRDGKYRFMVERCHFHTGHKSSAFIAELRVLSSSPNGEYEIAQDGKTTTDKPVVPNPAGTSCSLVCSWEFESGPANAKKFVLGVLEGFGYKEEQITEQVLDGVIEAKNPLHGMIVDCETYRDTNKGKKTPENRGKILVLQNWKGVVQTKEELAEQRQWLANNKAKVEEKAAAPAPAPKAEPAQTTAPAESPAQSGILGDLL